MYIEVSLKQLVFHIIFVFIFFHKISSQDERYYVKIVMIVDYHTYLRYSQNITRCKLIARKIVNGAAFYMKTHNVFISLVETIVWTADYGYFLNSNPDILFPGLTDYRNTHEYYTNSLIYANYTLVYLTNYYLNSTLLGRAYFSAVCSRTNSLILLKRKAPIARMGAVLAHEIGHLLSMEHDDKGYCPCPNYSCIMFPSSKYNSTLVKGWTNCSFSYFNNFKKTALSQCLTIPPSEASYCGDGIVQSNEECDCGPSSTGCGPCCNAQTCTLTSNAVCGSGPCCNLTTCIYIEASSETICRQSADSNCDFVEYCNGQSQFCPEDKTVHDGVRCSLDGFCYKGKCGSPDAYCSYLNQGSAKRGSLLCFGRNANYKNIHPCGRDGTNSEILCAYPDIECGRLACDSNVTNVEFTIAAADVYTKKMNYSLKTSRQPRQCVTFEFESLIPKDAGYTPNGAVCGFDYLGICIDTKCIPVQQIINENSCPGNCNGHGRCDNFGQCHCDPGFNTTDCS